MSSHGTKRKQPQLTSYFSSSKRHAASARSSSFRRKRASVSKKFGARSSSSRSGTYRRSKRRRGIRRRRRKGGRSRQSLLNILTVPNYYDIQINNHCPGGTLFAGQVRCDWLFASQTSEKDPALFSNAGNITTLNDVSSMAFIANQVMVQQANPSGGTGNPAPTGGYAMKFSVVRAKSVQDLHNVNNFPVMVRAYKVMPRQAIPYNAGVGLGEYPIDAYGRGLANSSLNASAPNGSNTACNDWNKTLYQSPFFCEWFKILQCKKFTMPPGAHRYFKAGAKPYQVHPDHDVAVDSTHNYVNNNGFVVSYRSNEQFWLFQYASTMGISVTTDGTSKRPTQSAGCCMMLTSWFRYQYKFIDDNVPTNVPTNLTGYGGTSTSGFSDIIEQVPYVVNSAAAAATTVSVQTNVIELS